jgi:hypothetical protein
MRATTSSHAKACKKIEQHSRDLRDAAPPFALANSRQFVPWGVNP